MATGTEGNDNLTNDPTIPHDTIDARGGNDVITIRAPNSQGLTSPETVTVSGGTGSDVLIVDGGSSYLQFGGSGYDGSVLVRLGSMYEVSWTSIERLLLTGALYVNADYTLGDEIDILRLSPGFGGRVNTGGGNDQIIVAGAGNGERVRIEGAAGDDLIDFRGIASSGSGGFAHEALGGDGNDVLRGGGYTDRLDGGAGNDSLSLYQAPVFGKDSQIFDTALGGAGNDNFFFGARLTPFDVVTGGADYDTLVVQGNYAGGLILSAKVTQIEAISLLAGNNTAYGAPGTASYNYSITTNNANFAAGVEAKINAAALLPTENFTFNGSAETDARFLVYGGRGIDTLTGGHGNDTFFFAENHFAPADAVSGGPGGNDSIVLRGNYTIDFNAAGHGLLTSIENLTLSSATDERYARGGGTEFDYNIKLADSHLAAGATLTVSGALLQANETMILDGSLESNGILNIFGGRAADTLKGGSQGDVLHGNLGADLLTGNGGVDLFRYDNVAESTSSARDHILDFTTGTDKIDLSRIDANTNVFGNQDFRWIGSNAFSNKAGELRAEQVSGADWLLQGDTDGNGAADFVVLLTLQGPTPLGAAPDFIL